MQIIILNILNHLLRKVIQNVILKVIYKLQLLTKKVVRFLSNYMRKKSY